MRALRVDGVVDAVVEVVRLQLAEPALLVERRQERLTGAWYGSIVPPTSMRRSTRTSFFRGARKTSSISPALLTGLVDRLVEVELRLRRRYA
jgi:hypothetical protein